MTHLFDINPLTYKNEYKKELQKYHLGLNIQPPKSPRLNYFNILGKANYKLVKNKTWKEHMRFCFDLYDLDGDGVISSNDLYKCLNAVLDNR